MKPIVGIFGKIVRLMQCHQCAYPMGNQEKSAGLQEQLYNAPRFFLGELAGHPMPSFDDEAKLAQMPFDTFAIEFTRKTSGLPQGKTLLALYRKSNDGIRVDVFELDNGQVKIFADAGGCSEGLTPFELIDDLAWKDEKKVFVKEHYAGLSDAFDRYMIADYSQCLLTDLLSCKNIATRAVSPSKSLNAKRLKKNKLPLYEYKVLTINNNIYAPGVKAKSKGKHEVRLHLRRGHIRNHPTAGKIWVTQCVVGNAEHGVIKKDYRIKGGNHE